MSRFSVTVRRFRPGSLRRLARVGWPTRRGVVLAIAAGLVLGFVALGLAQTRIETGVDSFLPAGDHAVDQYDELSRSFGGDPVVVLVEAEKDGQLLERGQLLRMLRLEGELSRLPGAAAVYGPATMLNQIAGRTQQLTAELSGRRDALRAQAEAEARQAGKPAETVAVAGAQATALFDRRYGALLVEAMPAGLPTLTNQSFVNSVVFASDGEPRGQWRFVMPSTKAAAILVRPRQDLDQAATEQLVEGVRTAVDSIGLTSARVTVSGVPALADSLGKKVRQEIPLLGGLALFAVALCFYLVPWRDRKRRLLPPISGVVATAGVVAVFGWVDKPLSLGVVAFLPVLLGVGSDFAAYLAQRAPRRVVLSVACATAVSFAALALTPLPFVRDLGVALGLGVLFAFLIGVLFAGPDAKDDVAGVSGLGESASRGEPAARGKTSRRAALCVVALIAAGGWVTLSQISVESDVRALASGLPAIADAQHIERVMGASGQIALVLRGKDVTSPEALTWMRQARDLAITEYGNQMRPVLSVPELLTFLGPSPSAGQITAAIRLLPPYLTSAVLRSDSTEAVLYFGVDVDDVASLSWLRDGLTERLPPAPSGYRVELTGLPMLATYGYESVSENRYLINTVGIAASGFVLALGLTRRSDAVRAVATAVLTTGVCFFVLWLTDTSVSPITVALGPLIAAVGCEFAVLLAESARRRSRALRNAVLLVAAASAIGYLILAFSGLAAIRQFGLLLGSAVTLSLFIAMLVVSATPASRREPEPREATRNRARLDALLGGTR